MAIIDIDDLRAVFDRERLRQLVSDFDPQVGEEVYNVGIITNLISFAEGRVKNALIRLYTVTQLEADDGIKKITCDIVVYFLSTRRSKPTEEITRQYQSALQQLGDLSTGKIQLAAADQHLPTLEIDSSSDACKITSSGMFDGPYDTEDTIL